MAWLEIEGHDDVVERFRRALVRGRLAHTYLFVGPAGVGKRTFARRLAQVLLCQKRPAELLDPCGECAGCKLLIAGTHPDLLTVSKPPEKSEIPLELFIGRKEKRMQEGLCHDISRKPFMGGRRVAIIADADAMNEEGANALLKTLEEPPPRSVMILVGTSLDRQLPTIRSRAQVVRFQPLAAEIVARLLIAQGGTADAGEAQRLAAYSGGSLTQALEMADPALWRFRDVLLAELARGGFDNVALGKTLLTFVEEAGKEASARRARMRQVMVMALGFYRDVLHALSGAPPSAESDAAHRAVIDRAIDSGTFATESVAAAADRCLEALNHVDRNANQSTLLECWLDDISQLAAGHAVAQG